MQTVEELVIACEKGPGKYDIMLAEQEDPEENKKTAKEEQQQSVFIRTKDKGECQQDCVNKHMKDNIWGRLYYGVCNVFKSVKSNFHSNVTKQDENHKVVAGWISYLQNNALKLHYKNKKIGNDVVIDALKKINKNNGGDITITDAITKLVEQRFESVERGLAFSFLTGLMRSVNRERESYCYKPFADTDLHSFVGAEKEQQECDIEQKQAVNNISHVTLM